MKVLIVFNHPAPYKVRAFNELAKHVDLTVIFERKKAKDRPDSFYVANQYNFKTIFLKHGYVGKEGTINSFVKNYIKKHHKEYDKIIMNGISHFSEILAIRYMQKNKIPYIVLINGGIAKTKEPCWKKKLKKSLISKAIYCLSPSQNSNEYLSTYGAKKENIYNYPYTNMSIEEINVKVDVENVRNKYNLPIDSQIYVNASQFIERKNNLALLEHFKNKKDILLLVGSGPLQETYKKYIRDNNMSNIHILPFLKKENLFELLASCNYFITLAKEDIFGHTTLEALANNLPVISSNKVNSSVEYIKNGINGYLIDPENDDEIEQAITNIKNIDRTNLYQCVLQNTYEKSAEAIYEILNK